jgi:hypothetical protein
MFAPGAAVGPADRMGGLRQIRNAPRVTHGDVLLHSGPNLFDRDQTNREQVRSICSKYNISI